MISTIIQLKTEINEQHYHDKGKAVYVVVNGIKHGIQSVQEYENEVLISCDEDDVKIMEPVSWSSLEK